MNVTLCLRREARITLTTTFAELGATPEIIEALEAAEIRSPFPIQEMAIPIALEATDVIAQARTGTGKTLAFGIPVLQHLRSGADSNASTTQSTAPQALVITPTRELALQVSADLTTLGSRLDARTLTVYGGVAYDTQLSTLKKGVEVVVGTPGRLLDLVDRNALKLDQVRSVVLDEADRMLDLGFLPDVEKLLAHTHEDRQTLLFSATMPASIMQLARRHMRQPVNVRAETAAESQTVPATTQFVYRAHDLDKPEVLARVLQAEDRGRVIIFCTTKRQAQRVADDLADRGFGAGAIHGDLGQEQRERTLTRFRDNRVDVLVATDVAARGLDVEGVTHVVNYTCPDDEKTYVHRIGRTGRAGASGIALTFVDWPDTARWKMINKTLELDFDEPVETYSTSSHLYEELSIPTDAKGRIGKPPERTSGSSDKQSRSSDGEPKKERSSGRGGRSRSRRRSGAGRGSGDTADHRSERQVSEAPSGERSSPERSERRPPRNRRRLRGGVPVEVSAEGAGTGGDASSAQGSTAQDKEAHTAAAQDAGGSSPVFQPPAAVSNGGSQRADAQQGEATDAGSGTVPSSGEAPARNRRRRRSRRRSSE